MEKLPILILFVFGVLLCAFGGFWIRLGRKVQAIDRQIALAGVLAEAQITDHHSIRGRGSHSFYITFEYTVNTPTGRQEKFTQETEISGADYFSVNPGDRVAIRYLPDAPKEVMLQGGLHEQTVPSFLTPGIGAIVFGAILIIIGIVAWLR